MRYNKIGSIVKLLFMFFKRSVMNFGILKSKLFRIILFVGLSVVTGIMTVLVYNLLEKSGMANDLTKTILDVYSLTTAMWTFVVFLFMKILFIKKDSFMKFATQMPVTKEEKNVALVVFEIVISLIIVNVIALSVVIAFIAKGGITILPRVLCNVFFTCTNVYLILELINRLAAWLVSIFELNRLKETILTCLFMGILMIIYSVVLPKLTDGILFNYLDNRGASAIALFAYIMDKTHFIVSAYLSLALVLALMATICLIPEDGCERHRQYIDIKFNIEKIPFIRRKLDNNSLFGTYFVNISRRTDTLNLGIITVFSYFMAIIMKIENPEYAFMIYAINGLYMCIQTEGIRNILYQKYYDVIKDYAYMIFSQLLYCTIISIPFTVISLLKGNDIKSILFMYVIMAIINIFSIFVGIVFVPKRENPITIMIGMFATIVFILIIALGIFILQIGRIGQVSIIIALTAVVIYYSLIGLVSLKKENCYGY